MPKIESTKNHFSIGLDGGEMLCFTGNSREAMPWRPQHIQKLPDVKIEHSAQKNRNMAEDDTIHIEIPIKLYNIENLKFLGKKEGVSACEPR